METEFLSIAEAMRQGSGEVAIRGWVYRERGSNKLRFIILRDSTNVIQCVFEKEKFEKQWDAISKLQMEASLEITGEINKEERAPSGYEIHATGIRIVGESNEFPINKDLNEELLGDRRHLWLRSRKMSAMLKIRDTVLSAMRDHWRAKGFYEFNTPSILGLQCEGGATLFKVDYFGKPLNLAQTWQLHAEPGIFALEKIFTIQPSFRAEKSKTSRHLTEFWHAEMEAAWENFDYLQDDAEALIKAVVSRVLEKNETELALLKRDPEKLKPVLEKKFPRMTYSEALKVLDEKKKMKVEWGKDLRTVEEDKLSELYDTPIIVTHYPKSVKAFYMKQAEFEKDKETVFGFDMIAPEGYGEIVGGSEREEDIAKLKANLVAQGEKPEEYDFILTRDGMAVFRMAGMGWGLSE